MLSQSMNRRVALGGVSSLLLGRRRGVRAQSSSTFGLPIGLPDRVPGDGFIIRHGYATENTWYNPGWLHTGEDWYVIDGETAGARLYAVADGEVVFVGSEYPGLVVIVRHADDLYAMYGHLDYALAVETGTQVRRGDLLGTVLARTDGRAPSHLHFEMRTFLTTPEVNGNAPRYSYGCGFECPPGPGYWPVDAPEHPSDMGWRNPTHIIAQRAFDGGKPPAGAEIVVANGARESVAIWSDPADHDDAEQTGELSLTAGDRYRLITSATGREATQETSAEGYRLWYRIELPDGERAWVQAAIPSSNDTGSDGRPSSVRFDFVPAETTAE